MPGLIDTDTGLADGAGLAWRDGLGGAGLEAGGSVILSYVIDVAGMSAGSVAPNSLGAGLTNPAAFVQALEHWTPAPVNYLISDDESLFVVQTSSSSIGDVEVDTWMRRGVVYMRLDDTGKGLYFSHNGETDDGTLSVGIVTGSSPLSAGTLYELCVNDDLVGTAPGYNKSDTTGAVFTFGVSGFDVYVEFNGTEIMRFKEYRMPVRGSVALRGHATDYGFRDITITLTAAPSMHSTPSAFILDMRDFGLRELATTGTISASSTSLVVASAAGLEIGDWVIVEIGDEAGAGARGTVGVGGTWPALSYATTVALQADLTKPDNTFAWAVNTGDVWQYDAGEAEWVIYDANYYAAKALPRSLHARITDIVGTTLTLDTAATVTATDAAVYLDNGPIINCLTARVTTLDDITPDGVRIVLPEGSYAMAGAVWLEDRIGWTIEGQGAADTELFSPKGVHSAMLTAPTTSPSTTIKDLTLSGNAGELEGYGLALPDGIKPDTAFLLPSGLMDPQFAAGVAELTQTVFPVAGHGSYPFGIFMGGDNSVTQDCVVNNVFLQALGAQAATNCWVYRCVNNENASRQEYTQWQFLFSNCTGGGMEDCTLNSVALIAGCEAFASSGTSFIRLTLNNGIASLNGSDDWLYEDLEVTLTAQLEDSPSMTSNNPMMGCTANTGPGGPLGGRILNCTLTQAGYRSGNNDIQPGIVVNDGVPNVRVIGGIYTAPDYLAPSAQFGAIGYRSQGLDSLCQEFTVVGLAKAGSYNIGIFAPGDGDIVDCTANSIT